MRAEVAVRNPALRLTQFEASAQKYVGEFCALATEHGRLNVARAQGGSLQ
jgi:hypothetical protein